MTRNVYELAAKLAELGTERLIKLLQALDAEVDDCRFTREAARLFEELARETCEEGEDA